MRKILLVALGTFACCLTSCASVHAVRWSYGAESNFDKPSKPTASVLLPLLGVPLIFSGVVFDAVTWPVQLAFGVWPWWGTSSLHMKPDGA